MPDPRAVPTLLMPHPRDWQGTQMPRSCPGEGWAQLELTDALVYISEVNMTLRMLWLATQTWESVCYSPPSNKNGFCAFFVGILAIYRK